MKSSLLRFALLSLFCVLPSFAQVQTVDRLRLRDLPGGALCGSGEGQIWLDTGAVKICEDGTVWSLISTINAKQTALNTIGNVTLGTGADSTGTITIAVVGTDVVITGSDDLLTVMHRLVTKTSETGDGTLPGVFGGCETAANGGQCVTFELPSAIDNPLGYTFPNARPSVDGTIWTLGATSGNKTAVTLTQLLSSGIILPALLPAATDTAQGAAELATSTEISTATDAARVMTPDAFAGSNFGERAFQVTVIEQGTACTTGDDKARFIVPATLDGWEGLTVEGWSSTVGSVSGSLNFDIDKCSKVATGNICSGTVVDYLSTNGVIDNNETQSDTGTPPVVSSGNKGLVKGDVLRFNVDACPGTPGNGLVVNVTVKKP